MHQPEELSELISKGGPLMWPLFGVSTLGLAVIVERITHFTRARIRFDALVEELCASVRRGRFDTARGVVEHNDHPLARLATDFLKSVDSPADLRSEMLRREGGILLETASRRLPLLRLVVQIAPILGLLGTVHGLLFAFWALEGLEGPVRPSDVAGGIGSALTTTVFGLSIAIPASAALLMFEEQVDRLARRFDFLVSHLEESLIEFRTSDESNQRPTASRKHGETKDDPPAELAQPRTAP